MTGKERITAILKHQSVDRIGIYEHFWNDTYAEWRQQGHIGETEDFDEHFNFDLSEVFPFNMMARYDCEPIIVAEDTDTITYFDGNGATLRRHKFHDTTPEHVDFKVQDREMWETYIKPFLTPNPKRINFEAYRAAKQSAAKGNRFFFLSYLNVFECIHPVCGHEQMLASMILDPEWVQEMANTYADLLVNLQSMLFDKEGLPDGIWYYEDLGYKGSPFMSPTMYREIIKPAHIKTVAFAKSLGLPVVMHSCGFVEPLLMDMIETGIDCLQVIEVKAGMDLLKLHKQYGDKIAFMGGIDVRCLYSNNKLEIDDELNTKIPFVKNGFNFVLHSDHSIPKTVTYETYKYFMKKGLELGRY